MNTREVAQQYRMNEWAQRIREQKASGLSIAAWCAQNDIGRHQFFYWQRRLREAVCEELAVRAETSIGVPQTFAEIKLQAEATGAIVVRLNGAEVEIRNGTSPELAASVLHAIKTKC